MVNHSRRVVAAVFRFNDNPIVVEHSLNAVAILVAAEDEFAARLETSGWCIVAIGCNVGVTESLKLCLPIVRSQASSPLSLAAWPATETTRPSRSWLC